MATGTNPTWPTVQVGIGFLAYDEDGLVVSGDPNDARLRPIYTDVTTRNGGGFSTARGKSYELDQARGEEHKITLLNEDAAFDPTNEQSPYWPHVTTYRPVRIRAYWPPTVNLCEVNVATGGEAPTFTGGAADGLWLNPAVTTTVARDFVASGITSFKSVFGPDTVGSAPQPWTAYTGVFRPGEAHTWSVYACRNSAAAVSVQARAVCYSAAGTVLTTVTGAVVDLAVGPTFTRAAVTVTPPAATVAVGLSILPAAPVTTANTTVYADQAQWERADTATPWAPPTAVQPLLTGYVESWLERLDEATRLSWVDLTCTDNLGVLSQIPMLSALAAQVVLSNPLAYYQLAEPESSGSAVATVPVGRADPGPMTFRSFAIDTRFGPANPTFPSFGVQLVGMPGAGATVDQSGTISPSGTGASWPFPEGFPNSGIGTTLLAGEDISGLIQASTGDRSVWILEAWVILPQETPDGYTQVPVAALTNQRGEVTLAVAIDGSPATTMGYIGDARDPTLGYQLTSSIDIADGAPHMLTVVLDYPTSGVGDATLSYLVDSEAALSTTVDMQGTDPPMVPGADGDQVILNVATVPPSSPTTFGGGNWTPGVISHVAVFDPASQAPFANTFARWLEGTEAGDDQDTGLRMFFLLRNAGWHGPSRIPNGYARVQALIDSEGKSALDTLLLNAQDELSNLYVTGDGTIVMEERHERGRQLQPKWTLGEDAEAGEIPYAASATFELDPMQVANRITAQRPGGVTVSLSDLPSVRRNFARDYPASPLTLRYTTDNALVEAAEGLLYRYRDPHDRVANIAVDPAANPALWPFALGGEISDRTTVKRRLPRAGVTKVLDTFIERITHDVSWGTDNASWTTSLECSPAFWHAFLLVSAARTTLAEPVEVGATTLTLAALPDAAVNPAAASGWTAMAIPSVTIWDPDGSTETLAVDAMSATAPGYTSFTVTLADPTTTTHAAGAVVSEEIALGDRYDTFDSAAQLDDPTHPIGF